MQKKQKAKLTTNKASSMLRWRQTHQRNLRTQEVLPAAQTCRHIFVLQCSGSAHLESSNMDRPHNVTCILVRQMQLMLTKATPWRDTNRFHHCVSITCHDAVVLNHVLTLFYHNIFNFSTNTSVIPIAQHNCPGTDPRVCPGPDVAKHRCSLSY